MERRPDTDRSAGAASAPGTAQTAETCEAAATAEVAATAGTTTPAATAVTDATIDATADAGGRGGPWRWYWEDFIVGAERRFGATTVTREAIVSFARAYDPQPFHLDDAAARDTPFGGLCASGWHTCALTMRMMCDAYLNDSASLGSPGLDHIRWLAPVFPGDTLQVRMTVLAARPMASRPEAGLVQSRWEVFNQDGRAVLRMEGWGMMRRRNVPGAGGAPARHA